MDGKMKYYIVSYLTPAMGCMKSATTLYSSEDETPIFRDALAQDRALTSIREISQEVYQELMIYV